MTGNGECCKVDAVVTMDSKGQIVLPKDIRERAKLKANDKLAFIGCERDGELCCIILLKTDKLGSTVKGFLGPLFRDVMR
jgi:AbrB family looped-hinge helix DNA binding protein